jgi:hypothetical protein
MGYGKAIGEKQVVRAKFVAAPNRGVTEKKTSDNKIGMLEQITAGG